MPPEGLNLTQHCNPNYTLPELVQYNLAYSITSMLTLVAIAAILCAMVFYKAYKTILQRLFIYLTISILVYLAFTSLSIQLHPSIFKRTGDTMCKWTGYMGTSTYTCTLLLSFEISMYLLYMMYYQLRGKPLPVPSKCRIVTLEVVGLCVAAILPSVLLVIPLEYYGVNGAVCWVQVYENTNCTMSPGFLSLGKGIFSVYTVLISINLTTFVVLVCLLCWLACQSKQSRAQYLQTAKRTAILFVFLIGYTVIHLSSILIPFYMLKSNNKLQLKGGGMLLVCILTPASQFIRPLAYMFYLNSVKKFRWESTRSVAGEWRESWKLCCLKLQYWVAGKDTQTLLINNLDLNITPNVETSSHYESLGRTSVE